MSSRLPAALAPALLSAVVVALSASAAAAQSTTFTLTSGQITKDNFVTTGPSNDLSAFNYGGTGAIGVSDAGLANGQFDSVITFDAAALKSFFDIQFGPNSWDLLELRLNMTVVPTNNAIFNPNTAGTVNVAYLANDVWVEGNGSPMSPGVTGLSFSTLGPVIAGETPLVSTNQTDTTTGAVHVFDLPMLSALTSDVLAGGLVSFHLSADDGGSMLYGSRTNMMAVNRPTLFARAQASAIPEPSSLVLAGVASAASWLGYRRRRRASLAAE